MATSLAAAALALHALAATVWVGGMFFAYMALRPAAGAVLEPPQRLRIWARSLQLFFTWVWICILALLATGFWLIYGAYGGMKAVGWHIQMMLALGLAMMAIFVYLRFLPYRRLCTAVAGENWAAAGHGLGRIRRLVAVNLALGLIIVAVGSGGRLA